MTTSLFKLLLAYDGADFAGWQFQPGKRTVQGVLEHTLSRLCHTRVVVIGSGRTDSGVHARGQVASARIPDWRAGHEALQRALQRNLPNDISLLHCEQVPLTFHPIRHSIGKRYEYRIRWSQPKDPFSKRYFWQMYCPLDLELMREAAACLPGQHDFKSFQTTGSLRRSTIRNLRLLRITSQNIEVPFGSGIDYLFELEADGFLYNMVRNIVGSLVEVGRGRHSVDFIAQALAAKDRTAAGQTAPPEGLYLMRVDYPETMPSQTESVQLSEQEQDSEEMEIGGLCE